MVLMVGLAVITMAAVVMKVISINIAAKFLFTTFLIYLIYDNVMSFKKKKEDDRIKDKIKENLTKAEYEEYLEFGPRG